MRTMRILTPPRWPSPSQAAARARLLVPDSVYTAPRQLVAIDGARRLNLYCVGSGEPAVVLEAGSGNGMVTWRFVQAEIASFRAHLRL